mgnify:FL=1
MSRERCSVCGMTGLTYYGLDWFNYCVDILCGGCWEWFRKAINL